MEEQGAVPIPRPGDKVILRPGMSSSAYGIGRTVEHHGYVFRIVDNFPGMPLAEVVWSDGFGTVPYVSNLAILERSAVSTDFLDICELVSRERQARRNGY